MFSPIELLYGRFVRYERCAPMHPAGKRRRHSKLCKFANVPANESVGSLVSLISLTWHESY